MNLRAIVENPPRRSGRLGSAFLLSCVFFASTALCTPQDSAPSTQQTHPLTGNPTLDRAEAFLQGNRWQQAHDLLLPWLISNPHAPDRDRGLYLLAEAYYESGDRIRAFYQLDELLDNFPESRLFFPALEFQYRLADAYLNGYKDTFLGMAILARDDEAIEMLFRIQERSPGSPIAERALKRTADYYFNNSEFDMAADAYEAFIRAYPRSPEIPQVKLRQAFSNLAQFRGPRFDATPLINARSEFKAIELQYPDLAAEMNVPQWISHIDSDMARKAYLVADFYSWTGRPGGAVFMYRYVIQTYPNSPEANMSKRDLAKMPAWALREPPPPPSNAESAAQPLPTPPPENPSVPERPKNVK
jgi:outer membrane protein assembly factor BamD (BamD/ComL family)